MLTSHDIIHTWYISNLLSLTTIRMTLPKKWLAKMAPAIPIPPTIIMKRPMMMSKILSSDTLAGLFVTAKYVLLLT